jgi:hypothetical protein
MSNNELRPAFIAALVNLCAIINSGIIALKIIRVEDAITML